MKSLQAALGNVLARVDTNENEIRCLDDNILQMCSSIHALQVSCRPNYAGGTQPRPTSHARSVLLTHTPTTCSEALLHTPVSAHASTSSTTGILSLSLSRSLSFTLSLSRSLSFALSLTLSLSRSLFLALSPARALSLTKLQME